MEYYFNEIEPVAFQRLINSILVARFGEAIRLTPLRGADGGRDGETAPDNPYYEFQTENISSGIKGLFAPIEKGRYLFQVKHHRTVDRSLSDARQVVISDFENELRTNVLFRKESERVNYFILITNIPSSKEALLKLDEKRKILRRFKYLHADIWWKEQVTAYLDLMPALWNNFPEIFAGRRVPFLASVVSSTRENLPRAVRLAIEHQYRRDLNVKFRQIELEKDLSKLFVDLDVTTQHLADKEKQQLTSTYLRNKNLKLRVKVDLNNQPLMSAIGILLDEQCEFAKKIILEGGPGQGKSTITQMTVQIYRQYMQTKYTLEPEDRWTPPKKARLPFRVELRSFAEWLGKFSDASVEEYLAFIIKQDSGGGNITADDIHGMVENSPILLIFDGLDEIGSDDLKNSVITKILECLERFEKDLNSDLRIIITTRPPAIAGQRERLLDFKRLPIAPLEPDRVQNYLNRWLSVQLQDNSDERTRVRSSFERRKNEPHVKALVKNPMQLSVLLHFIRLKGEAFPDRRAELYKDYFQIVIDRDVEKSAELRKKRDIVEALHQFLGYKIHALTEAEQIDGTLTRQKLLKLVEDWLRARGHEHGAANELFKVGEERLGLIVTLKGEGEETRYGYEIQPIREYFAAAFINEQIRGNSHNIFQAMIRRQYWREVALFLAGLRRPNEKGDLIIRAKELDRDDQLGWRQEGRGITLQLLQEGVFSQPPHVFSEALDFVFDLLNPNKIKVQDAPEDLIEGLTIIIRQSETKIPREQLLKLIQMNRSCHDEVIVSRLFNLASLVLDTKKVSEEILAFKPSSLDLIAKVRLFLAFRWRINVCLLSEKPAFWEGVPERTLAYWWWQAAFFYSSATGLAGPRQYHQYLFEQAAFNNVNLRDVYRNYYKDSDYFTLQSGSKWAIWRLLSFQRIYTILSFGTRYLPKEMLDQFKAIIKDTPVINIEGLDEALANVVTNLIKAYHEILHTFIYKESDLYNTIVTQSLKFQDDLKYPGITGMIVCRALKNILQSPWHVNPSSDHHGISKINVDFEQFISQNVALHSLWKDIELYYEQPIDEQYPIDITPTHIYLKSAAARTPIITLLLSRFDDTLQFIPDYIKYMTIPCIYIRPIVEAYRNDLKALFLKLSGLRIAYSQFAKSLITADMQKILKIVRETDEPNILNGALIALSTSKFIRVAGPDLTAKMFRYCTNNEIFEYTLFIPYHKEFQDVNNKDIDLVKRVAEIILGAPESYSFGIISSAANYLAEHLQVKLQPLVAEEVNLELYV